MNGVRDLMYCVVSCCVAVLCAVLCHAAMCCVAVLCAVLCHAVPLFLPCFPLSPSIHLPYLEGLRVCVCARMHVHIFLDAASTAEIHLCARLTWKRGSH